MANKDNSERIERFLRDQMSPEENQAFLDDLKSDKELREEAQIMALLIKGMKEEQSREEAEMKEGVKGSTSGIVDIGIAASVPPTPTDIPAASKPIAAKKKKWIYWAGAVAAMFVVVFGAVKFFTPQEEPTVIPKAVKSQKTKKKNIKIPANIEEQPIDESVAAEAPSDSTYEMVTDPSNEVEIAESEQPQSEETEHDGNGIVDESHQDGRAAP